MPQTKKYDDEFRMKAFDLYCEGKTPKQIAKVMGVTNLVIKRIKMQKFPKSWEQGRAERVLKKTEKIEKFALGSLLQVRVRLQERFMNLHEAAYKLLLQRIKNGEIDTETLVNAFFRLGEEELKLYVPLDVLFGTSLVRQTMVGNFYNLSTQAKKQP